MEPCPFLQSTWDFFSNIYKKKCNGLSPQIVWKKKPFMEHLLLTRIWWFGPWARAYIISLTFPSACRSLICTHNYLKNMSTNISNVLSIHKLWIIKLYKKIWLTLRSNQIQIVPCALYQHSPGFSIPIPPYARCGKNEDLVNYIYSEQNEIRFH